MDYQFTKWLKKTNAEWWQEDLATRGAKSVVKKRHERFAVFIDYKPRTKEQLAAEGWHVYG
jgi:hypothetical protein